MPKSWLLVAVSVMGEMNIYTVAAVSYDPGSSDPFIYNLSGLLTIFCAFPYPASMLFIPKGKTHTCSCPSFPEFPGME